MYTRDRNFEKNRDQVREKISENWSAGNSRPIFNPVVSKKPGIGFESRIRSGL
jgi:hypothetical protein